MGAPVTATVMRQPRSPRTSPDVPRDRERGTLRLIRAHGFQAGFENQAGMLCELAGPPDLS